MSSTFLPRSSTPPLTLLLLLVALLASCTTTPVVQPHHLYLLQRGDEAWNLVEIDPETGTTTLLLDDVDGFAAGPETFAIVLQDEQEIALWEGQRPRHLYHCDQPCRDLSWSADGAYLAWVEGSYQATTGWIMHLPSGEIYPLGEVLGRPVWAPQANKLAVAGEAGLTLWRAADAEPETLPLAIQSQPAWSPEGDELAVLIAPGTPALITPDLGFPQPLNVTDAAMQWTEVAWRPGARALALTGRRFNPPEHPDDGPHEDRPGAETLGPQPWLFDLETETLHALPGDASAGFARPLWSPDGRYLAMVRLDVGEPNPGPEVWIVDVDAGEIHLRIPNAALPAWSTH